MSTNRTSRILTTSALVLLLGGAVVGVAAASGGDDAAGPAAPSSTAPTTTIGSGPDGHGHEHGDMADHDHSAMGDHDDMDMAGHDDMDMAGHDDMDMAGHDDTGMGGHDHAAGGHSLPPLATRQAEATDAEEAAAWQLAADTKAAVAKYEDVEVALADGFRPNPSSEGGGVIHYPNSGNRRDATTLDPTAVEGLVYRKLPDGSMRLLGAVYTVAAGQEAPTPGGPMFQWHTHDKRCDSLFIGPGECDDTFRMLHVWVADGVVDPFTQPFAKAVRPA